MIKRRKKSKGEIEEKHKDILKRNNFFMKIWQKKPHFCANCEKGLGKEPRSYMFDHLIEKSKRRDLEFVEDNIALVCLICHDSKTNGFPGENHKKLIEQVKIKYNI